MADREIIVRIPEEAYKLLKNEGVDWLCAEHILNAVANGTPLSVVLDKIYDDIQRLRGCSCSCSDGIINDVEEILDKYKGGE